MPLQEQLESITAKLKALVPAERLKIIEQAIQQLKDSGVASARKPGDPAPQFELPDGDGQRWRSEDLLSKGPLIIVFYPQRIAKIAVTLTPSREARVGDPGAKIESQKPYR